MPSVGGVTSMYLPKKAIVFAEIEHEAVGAAHAHILVQGQQHQADRLRHPPLPEQLGPRATSLGGRIGADRQLVLNMPHRSATTSTGPRHTGSHLRSNTRSTSHSTATTTAKAEPPRS